MKRGSAVPGTLLHKLLQAGVAAGAAVAAMCGLAGEASAAVTAEQALKFVPLQAGVEIDTPPVAEIPQCTLTPLAGNAGWEVRGPNQELLRRFADTNGDRKIDLWSYFKAGIEVYRDVDSNFNGKADQYRWLGTAGTRWGVDADEDGTIDSWRLISPEETTMELVEAIKTRDVARFKRLLLSTEELNGLGLAAERKTGVATQIAQAVSKFEEYAKTQSIIAKDAQWIHFAALPPGTVPAGTEGSTKDVTAYENASAMVEGAGKQGQLQVGTLLQVAGGWRLIDLPTAEPNGGFLFAGPKAPAPMPGVPGVAKREQELVTKLNEVEKALSGNPANRAALLGQKADLMQQIATVVGTAEVQASWIRQLADTIAGSVQAGQFPKGAERLKGVLASISEQQPKGELTAYVKFRYLTCVYNEELQAPKANIPQVQENWLKQLEAYVEEFPTSKDAAEAMLQLALAQEFAGQDAAAKKWYEKINAEFSDDPLAKKAQGAVARLESVGKVLPLQGTTLQGKPLNLAQYQGKIVLIQYWASWCEPCKQEMGEIKTLLSQFGGKGFAVIGINLDNDKPAQPTQYPWPQLYEEGGLDSRLANELGVLTLPTMLLVDQAGRVIDRNANLGEVKKELEKRLK